MDAFRAVRSPYQVKGVCGVLRQFPFQVDLLDGRCRKGNRIETHFTFRYNLGQRRSGVTDSPPLLIALLCLLDQLARSRHHSKGNSAPLPSSDIALQTTLYPSGEVLWSMMNYSQCPAQRVGVLPLRCF